ncbi:MAG: hypothetical protein PVS3B3_31250 [Ktedonobacteraceae bacterium]
MPPITIASNLYQIEDEADTGDEQVITAEDIDAMDLDDLRANFSAYMGSIVSYHGDDQEVA